MKRVLALLFCLVFIIALPACREKEEDNGGKEGLHEEDLEFMIGEETFALNDDVEPMLSVLGEDYILQEAPSCLYEGMDKTFEYDGISIYTYPLDGKDLIDEIVLTDDRYRTSRGISVGSSMEELVGAYGDGYVEEGGIVTYRFIPDDVKSPCLYFIINDGIVESISLYGASNL